MSAVLKTIITDIKSKQNSLYMDYLDQYLAARNYTPDENQNALKNKYYEIIEHFKKKLQGEAKANKA